MLQGLLRPMWQALHCASFAWPPNPCRSSLPLQLPALPISGLQMSEEDEPELESDEEEVGRHLH